MIKTKYRFLATLELTEYGRLLDNRGWKPLLRGMMQDSRFMMQDPKIKMAGMTEKKKTKLAHDVCFELFGKKL